MGGEYSTAVQERRGEPTRQGTQSVQLTIQADSWSVGLPSRTRWRWEASEMWDGGAAAAAVLRTSRCLPLNFQLSTPFRPQQPPTTA